LYLITRQRALKNGLKRSAQSVLHIYLW
jgi:hypothetical protein